MTNYKDFIGIDSNIRFGKPIIKGSRISVFDVLNWLANGMTKQDIINDFPELDDIKIRACLSYAAHREKSLIVVS